MNIGDKIRNFRLLHKMTQDQLSELSGINKSTIVKYELGIRKPKAEQLLRIANALGISINVFLDLDITTISDLLSLVFKMDEQLELHFEADKTNTDEYDFRSLKISFQNDIINQKLLTYMLALQKRKEYLATVTASDDDTLAAIDANIAELKDRLIDDNTIIIKNAIAEVPTSSQQDASSNTDEPRSPEMNRLLHEVLFDCSANELELITQTAQAIKDCLRKQSEN